MVSKTVKSFRDIIMISACMYFSMTSAKAEGSIPLASHLAVYDLKLDSTSSKSGIFGLMGRMVFEFRGDKCQGYTTKVRFVSQIEGMDGKKELSDKQINSFESADGHDFRFSMKSYIDEKLDEEREGSAINNSSSIELKLKKPEIKDFKLAKAQFPTFEILDVISHAMLGKKFYNSSVFDGADEDNDISQTSTFIGYERIESAGKKDTVLGALSGMTLWPVTVSYFNDKEKPDGLPVYRTSFLLYKNGITSDMAMDYGTFAIRAVLKELVVYATPNKQSCENKKPSVPVY